MNYLDTPDVCLTLSVLESICIGCRTNVRYEKDVLLHCYYGFKGMLATIVVLSQFYIGPIQASGSMSTIYKGYHLMCTTSFSSQ